MEIRVSKGKDGVSLSGQVPQEILEAERLELFPLKKGAFLLTVKGFLENPDNEQQGPDGAFSKSEEALLNKLLAIRFDRRTPVEVEKSLGQGERETLFALVKKKAVRIYRSEKYKDGGVYNVSDEAFKALKRGAGATPSTPAESLEQLGYAALETEAEARQMGNSYAERIKAGDVIGLRAFDRRFYFIRKAFYDENEARALSLLSNGEKSEAELAAGLGIPSEACRALLLHMCENGEALEKARGKFAKA